MAILRFGQFNIRDLTMEKLRNPEHPQVMVAAKIIKRFTPDVLSINEMQADTAAPRAFIENFLKKGEAPVDYPFSYIGETNSGVRTGLPQPFDYKGYGSFKGQYGIACLSKFRMDFEAIKNYKDVPWGAMPLNYCGEMGCPEDFPLWSTAFLDIPVDINGTVVHFLLLHPTVPLRNYMNLRRNADQLRFLERYISGQDAPGVPALKNDAPFVIMGDLNADPEEGLGTCEVIRKFLNNGNITGNGQAQKTFLEGGGAGWPSFDRPGLLEARLDYILPSKRHFVLKEFHVFRPKGTPWWPVARRASDHFFIYADCELIKERPQKKRPLFSSL